MGMMGMMNGMSGMNGGAMNPAMMNMGAGLMAPATTLNLSTPVAPPAIPKIPMAPSSGMTLPPVF
jgi:hypothetical protein